MEKNQAAGAGEHVYEDIEPLAEWVSEPEFDTLIVYLPGFKKEQLKVQMTSTHKLRVLGERPVGSEDTKWIRFRKEFPISPNYDTNNIIARFEGGTLFIKHPKIKITSTADNNKINGDPRQQIPAPSVSNQNSKTHGNAQTQPSTVNEKEKKTTQQTKTQKAKEKAPKTSMAMEEKPRKDSDQKGSDRKYQENDQKGIVGSNGKEQRKEKTAQSFKSKNEQEQTSKTSMATEDDQKPGKTDHDAPKEKSDVGSDDGKHENQKVTGNEKGKSTAIDSARSSEINGRSKLKMKDGATRVLLWARERKNGREVMNLVVAVLLIMVMGIYAWNAFKSIPKSENN